MAAARASAARERRRTCDLVVHHIAADGRSMLPLLSDIVTAYTRGRRDRNPRQPLAVQFADFRHLAARGARIGEQETSVLGRQLAYWREHLARGCLR